jgi:hypothetical protein
LPSYRAHEDLGNQLMNTSLSADDIARIGREYSQLGRKNELADKRADLMRSIKELTEMEIEERSKYDLNITLVISFMQSCYDRGVEGSELADMALMELEEAKSELTDIEESLLKLIMPR